MHPELIRIYAEGTIPGANGEGIQVTSHIPREEAELLYAAIEGAGRGDALEVGMAFGVSSLALADALARRDPDSRLVVMDPAQHDDTWRGLGLKQIERAGLGNRIEFHERSSQVVLPELWQRGRRFSVAFIDGWHTFDHTLVDCFYADKMLDVGGCLVLDDVGYPAIRRVAAFLLANREYSLQSVAMGGRQSAPRPFLSSIKRLLGRLTRTDATPRPEHQAVFRALEGAQAVALRKVGHDERRFDHYAAF